MNFVSTESMNDRLFDEWQDKLFRFVHENKRKFTEQEWQWMRYQFEIEHMCAGREETPSALAADNDISLGVRDHDTKCFTGSDGKHQYEIKITCMDTSEGVWETYIDCVDEKREHVSKVKLVIRDEFQLNDEDWLIIDWDKYVDNIKNATNGLKCSVNGGKLFDLTCNPELSSKK